MKQALIHCLEIGLFAVTAAGIMNFRGRNVEEISHIITQRQNYMKQVASFKTKKKCDGSTIIHVLNRYGRTGNDFITLANTLWVTHTIKNAIFMIPNWAKSTIFDNFDLRTFTDTFCTTSHRRITDEYISISGGEAYSLHRLFNVTKLKPLLPPLNEGVISNIAHFYTKFYASLWCCPHHSITAEGISLIKTFFSSSLDYVSIHQRSHEGNCRELYCDYTKISQFSKLELNFSDEEWHPWLLRETNETSSQNHCPRHHHPLCGINSHTVRSILQLIKYYDKDCHINTNSIHLGSDMHNNSNELVTSLGAVIPQYHVNNTVEFGVILDMFIFIHSGLFIQNPLSTLSTGTCIVRQTLGLRTIPVLNTSRMSIEERAGPGWWITCDMIALRNIRFSSVT